MPSDNHDGGRSLLNQIQSNIKLPNVNVARELLNESASSSMRNASIGSTSIMSNVKVPAVYFPSFDLSPLSTKMEQVVNQHMVALFFGVSIGAAVSAGLFAGVSASSSFIRWLCRTYPALASDRSRHSDYEEENERCRSILNASTLDFGRGFGKVLILRSDLVPRLAQSSERKKLEECIYSLKELMDTCRVMWEDIRKMTVTVASEDFLVSEFFEIIESIEDFPHEKAITSIVHVKKLEHGAVLSIEVFSVFKTM